MSRKRGIQVMAVISLLGIVVLGILSVLRTGMNKEEWNARKGVYETLPEDISTGDPLEHIGNYFLVDEEFHSNLPIVILSFDGRVSEYKTFQEGQEVVYKSVEPYTDGTIRILDNNDPEKENCVSDTPVYTSIVKAKKRGHTSEIVDRKEHQTE